MKIRVSGVTHRGLKREKNEDSMLIFDRVIYDNEEAWSEYQEIIADNFLFAVADGVGGAPAGDFASQFVLNRVSKCKHLSSRALAETIKIIHKNLLKANTEDPSRFGSATTIAGIAYSAKEGILVFNVGDARVYRIFNDSLNLVSTDDNVLSILSVQDAFTLNEDVVEYLSNYLLQSIGGLPGSRVKPHVEVIVPVSIERFFICTDGLHKVLDTLEMERVFSNFKGPDKILKELLKNALIAGGPDNITAICVEIEFPQTNKTGSN